MFFSVNINFPILEYIGHVHLAGMTRKTQCIDQSSSISGIIVLILFREIDDAVAATFYNIELGNLSSSFF